MRDGRASSTESVVCGSYVYQPILTLIVARREIWVKVAPHKNLPWRSLTFRRTMYESAEMLHSDAQGWCTSQTVRLLSFVLEIAQFLAEKLPNHSVAERQRGWQLAQSAGARFCRVDQLRERQSGVCVWCAVGVIIRVERRY